MAYVTPGTVAAGDVATAAAWNVLTNDVIDHEARFGFVKILTTTGTAATSLSLPNCFSSTYANYRVVVSAIPSTNMTYSLRFRDVGGVVSAANYNYTNTGVSSATGVLAVESFARSQTQALLILTTSQSTLTFDVIGPNLLQNTVGTGTANISLANSYFIGFGYTATTQMTGFDIYPSTGTLTGSVTVYGYIA